MTDIEIINDVNDVNVVDVINAINDISKTDNSKTKDNISNIHLKSDSRHKMIKWLGKKTKYTETIFDDPGYTDCYKRMFNVYDHDRKIYRMLDESNKDNSNKDIDIEINIGYIDDVYNQCKKTTNEKILEQYIDYIPINIPDTFLSTSLIDIVDVNDRKNIKMMLCRENIVIPPGSNQSNCNWLFKKISEHIESNNIQYKIPFVLNDHKMSYTGAHKIISSEIDKEKFYNFMFKNSTK